LREEIFAELSQAVQFIMCKRSFDIPPQNSSDEDVKLAEDVAGTVAMLVQVSAMIQTDMAEADARTATAEAKLASVSGKKNRFRGSMKKGLTF
jgi:phage gp29-like protein